MRAVGQPRRPDLRERAIGELLKQLSAETTTLVRQELELAKAELTEKGKEAGKGAGMFGGAGVVGLLAARRADRVLHRAAGHRGWTTWLAALIVAVVYGAIAGVLALQGRDQVQAGDPARPRQTIESVKEDVEWAKTRTRSARR